MIQVYTLQDSKCSLSVFYILWPARPNNNISKKKGKKGGGKNGMKRDSMASITFLVWAPHSVSPLAHFSPPFEDWTTASLRRLPRSLRSLDSTDTMEGYYSHLLNLLSPFLAAAGLFISNILYIMVYRSTQQIHQYYLETIGLCIFFCVCVYYIREATTIWKGCYRKKGVD